jgi:hypothetical protein
MITIVRFCRRKLWVQPDFPNGWTHLLADECLAWIAIAWNRNRTSWQIRFPDQPYQLLTHELERASAFETPRVIAEPSLPSIWWMSRESNCKLVFHNKQRQSQWDKSTMMKYSESINAWAPSTCETIQWTRMNRLFLILRLMSTTWVNRCMSYRSLSKTAELWFAEVSLPITTAQPFLTKLVKIDLRERNLLWKRLT